jgi:hypothetical protein
MIIRRFLLLFVLLPLVAVPPAAADRAGWNEPPRAAGYDRNGLLTINADFFALAAATGGDCYFWAPGEFAAAAGLLKVPVASEPIALAYGSSAGPFAQTLEVPVDATVSRLSLFAGAQRLDTLRLLRPDGRNIDANPAGADVQDFHHMRIITVADPEPGLWQVELRGAGRFELAARYLADRSRLEGMDREAIDLIDFTFVERRGRPGHEGLFPLQTTPLAGTSHRCRITLTGGIEPTTAEMISATGMVLGKIRLERPAAGDIGNEFIGSCRVPDQLFRVRVRGRDFDGRIFQRLTAGLVTPAVNPSP